MTIVIELLKEPAPVWLTRNQATKTAEYLAAPAGKKPTVWSADDLIAALRREGRDKCMYCEGVVDDVAYVAVEHIRPRKYFPELVLDWDNLGLACTRCNTNKGSYWTENDDLRILNPYVDTIAHHLTFVGPVVACADGSTRGRNTIRQLKFHRNDLVLSRLRRIEELEVRLQVWFDEPDSERKALFEEDVRDALAPDQEFSATLVEYARARRFLA